MNNQIDSNHTFKRQLLRIAGITTLILGIILLIIGMSDFFSAMKSPFGQGPTMFWLNFIALPLIAVGAALTASGFSGAVARYHAGEMAPVGKDTFNYMAQGTSQGIKTIARSIQEGIKENQGSEVICPNCQKSNPPDSTFCNCCGSRAKNTLTCQSCGHENVSGSQFCNKCGADINQEIRKTS